MVEDLEEFNLQRNIYFKLEQHTENRLTNKLTDMTNIIWRYKKIARYMYGILKCLKIFFLQACTYVSY
jgi:hypothetical protein